jgi:hypothetical protein
LIDATTKGKVGIESKDFDNELVTDNGTLREEIKKLKL